MVTIIDTLHSDMIHDAQFDFPGRRVATCSSDRTVRIYQVESSGTGHSNSTSSSSDYKQQHRLIAILDGHDGPVWQVCWAHPKFGSLLASCSYDRKVILWKESPVVTSGGTLSSNPSNSATNSTWTKFHEYDQHKSSVNSIIWAPHELGLVLAACSSDGSASVIDYTGVSSSGTGEGGQQQPEVKRIANCHQGGCNAISWGPSVPPSALLSNDASFESYQKTFVTGGCDNLVKIWSYNEDSSCSWVLEETLHGHRDWVRDVAWAPSVGLPLSTIASCSQDGIVKIWRKEVSSSGVGVYYQSNELYQFPDVVWHVSWSFTGNILAVSGGDNEVTLWKETEDNKWEKISEVNKTDK
ncbi:protein SEC13 homolog [Symsagittifera roscoffensis]|uniref:protein SEC13 homolog n=1 Tax=Symsagittifera roscoffensis TaxID=84072 RepID=UPI00307B63A1